MNALANPLWRGEVPVLLASKSAARRELLSAARVPFEPLEVNVDERVIEAGARGGPDTVAILLAKEKARAGSEIRPEALVIGADQTLALGSEAFHKPVDRDAARFQLSRLSGRTHALHSGVAVARGGAVLFATVETARLTMRTLDGATLDAYLDAAGDTVLSSVGGYQLEGLGIHLFDRIEGDHSVILGLPLLPLLAFFRTEGYLL